MSILVTACFVGIAVAAGGAVDERYLRATVLVLVDGLENGGSQEGKRGKDKNGNDFSKKNAVLFLSLLFHWQVLP